MKKAMLCLVALLALVVVFVGPAAAQIPGVKPTATIHEQVAVRPSQGVLKPEFRGMLHGAAQPLQPTYCSPCLFYAGDSDPSNFNADGLWDNNSSYFGINGIIYTPFTPVKIGKCGGKCAWLISGIGGNIEMYPFPPTIDSVAWSLVKGVAAGGTPGSTTTICSGTDSAPTITDTGRLFFGLYEEFNVTASTGGACKVKPSKKTPIVWQTNQVNTSVFQLAYESNVPDSPPPNAFGPAEPVDQSYFYSPAFGFPSFTNTTQLGPFDVFSTDIEGTLGK